LSLMLARQLFAIHSDKLKHIEHLNRSLRVTVVWV